MTNTDTVEGNIQTGPGNDTIDNSGTVGDIKAGNDDDTITHSGTADLISGGYGDDIVTLEGDETLVVTDEVCGGEGTDTLDFRMSTYNAAEYDAAKTVIAAGSDGEFTWGEVLLKWSGFESLFDHLSFLGTRVSESKPEPAPVTASLIAVEEALLKVYQNDDSNTLRFYGLSGNQVFIAELSPSIWQNAAEGDILLDVENITLGTQLVVTMMANGQLQIEYFDLDDGSILYSKVITL
ncbi:MAG: hypothetical protein HN392_09740 [Anaerolineae bacterium]|nr:hypothetical protein [Anaerolineae bacterium]MBT7781562.1 hypothetical protein [Anaerolineae bacterium]